jgi:hypothetical protein
MTVEVGRTQIHLGWPTAGSIIAGIVIGTWGAAIGFGNFMRSQDEMKKQLSIIIKNDSLGKLEVAMLKRDVDSMKNNRPLAARASRLGYYTERKINGRIVLAEVTN